MKALYTFVVRLPNKFKNTFKLGDKELFLASKFNEFENRYNYGEIVSVPQKFDTGASVGDILYFHHHVCVEKRNHLQEDLYLVQYDPNGGYGSHAYAFETADGAIHMLSDWVFVVPPEREPEKKTESGLIIMEKEVVEDHGTAKYISEPVAEAGVNPGDTVYFTKNSDYTMEVKGEKLWRMRLDDLVYVLNE